MTAGAVSSRRPLESQVSLNEEYPDVAITEARVRELLSSVVDKYTQRDIVGQGSLRSVAIDADRVTVDLRLAYPAVRYLPQLATLVRQALSAEGAISQVDINSGFKVHAQKVQQGLTPLPGIRNVIAVASGKGGVGKSTTAVNLALALRDEGASVGVLDADIYGPSIPRMLSLSGKPESADGKHLEPKLSHGIQAMSIGLMIDEDTPMIWRGPMVTQALQQMLSETRWDDLDYLVIDLPPGTGDIQLTLCQKIPVSGAVIVTTPQDIALLDARKALKMFEKVSVPVLGIIENMAVHVCSKCGHAEHVFGAGGGERMAAQYGVPLLGSLPLDIRIREDGDQGVPTVEAAPDSDVAEAYREIARRTGALLSLRARDKSIALPKIVMQNT